MSPMANVDQQWAIPGGICKRFEGRVAVITGSSTGLGRATAFRLASEGASIVCSDLNKGTKELSNDDAREKDTDVVLVEHGSQAIYVPTDVGNEEDVMELAAKAVGAFGRIDIWVNCAGIGAFQDITDMTKEDFTGHLAVNLVGTWMGCREAARQMKTQELSGPSRGKIVNFASMAALIGQGGLSAYCAGKGGVAGMTRDLAVELAPYYINVNAVAPGYHLTSMTRSIFEDSDHYKRAKARTPWPELGTPQHVADSVAFLASDDAAFVTGIVLSMDGGAVAGHK